MLQSGTVVSSLFYNNATSTLTLSNNNSGIQFNTSGASPALTLSSAGAATFSSSVTIAAGNFLLGGSNRLLYSNGSTANYIYSGGSDGLRVMNQADSAILVTIANSGAATFSSSVAMGGATPTNFGAGYNVVSNNGTSSGIYESRVNNAQGGNWGSDSGQTFMYEPRSLPITFGTVNTERMRITSGGNILVNNTSSVGSKLIVKSDGTTSASFACIFWDSASSDLMYVRSDGYGYLKASAWVYGSDLRMKENVSNVENGLDMVLKMKPKHFDYINGQKDNIGFIAQDIQKIIPQAVSITNNKTGMLGLKTDFLVPYIAKAVQELKLEKDIEISELKAQIEELKELIMSK
jgi:hypothetical protein